MTELTNRKREELYYTLTGYPPERDDMSVKVIHKAGKGNCGTLGDSRASIYWGPVTCKRCSAKKESKEPSP